MIHWESLTENCSEIWHVSIKHNINNVIHQIDGLVQKRRNSSANALELRLSCTNPSKYAAKFPSRRDFFKGSPSTSKWPAYLGSIDWYNTQNASPPDNWPES